MAEPATRFPMMTETDDARPAEARPFEGLRQEIDRMFDDFQRGYWRLPFGRTVFDAEPFWRGGISWNATPAVDIVEHEHGYRLTAELPGIEEKNVSVSFADGTLTIKGEKQEQKADKQKDYYVSERRYGSFQRSFRVPEGVDADKIEASFKHGLLTVNLPKSAQAQKTEKRIEVKGA
jgi:HSP20 family protein